MRLWCVALALLVTMPAGAQVAASRARPDSFNALPRFPDMMRAAQLGGTVRVRVVVDSAGHVERDGMTVLHSDHELLSASTRNALTQWRFVPARRDGRAVPDTIEQDVTFNFPSEFGVAVLEPVVLARAAVAPGHYRLVIGWPDADPAAPRLDSAATNTIALATLDRLVESLVPKDTTLPTRVVCVGVADSVRTGQPDAPALRRLARSRLAVLVARRCPPTFTSMIALVGPDGRVIEGPPGEDPWSVEILTVRSYATGLAVVEAAIHHGTGSSYYRCRADRGATTPMKWEVACKLSGMSVSSTEAIGSRGLAGSTSRQGGNR